MWKSVTSTLAIAVCLNACNSTVSSGPAAEALYVNQLGFAPNARKTAIAHSDSLEPLIWYVHNSDGEISASGRTVPLGFSPRAGQSLHRIDMSSLTDPGTAYELSIGETISPDFDISTGLYQPLMVEAGRYFYHNRAAEPILAEHVGEDHARPAGHPSDIASCFSGEDKWGTNWPGCDYELDVTGGWYDAGDHGKYVVNSGISVWTLVNAHERFANVCGDGCLNIPESGNGIGDLLDEARHNIEFMLSMQVPDGTRLSVAKGKQTQNAPLTLTEIDAGGLVHHKVADEKWAGDGVFPHENRQTRYIYPPSTGATLDVAAIAAQCARVWANIDAGFSAKCQRASDRAIRAAKSHPDIWAYNNFDGSGPYGDTDYTDEFFWAAAERADKLPTEIGDAIAPGFNKTTMLGLLTAQNRAEILKVANGYLDETSDEPLHIPFARDRYQWGSNSQLTNRAIILGTAYDMTGERKYRDAVVDMMDYLLGRNPLNQSYISGFGDQQFFAPHHRHWARPVRADAPIVPPGVLSGGPNNDNMSDPVAKTMVGKCAAQTCWRDEYSAWTQNEVTINWNAPLLWMSAFLVATE